MKNVVFLIISFVVTFSSFSQDLKKDSISSGDTIQFKITLHDGIEYVGQILQDDGREVLIFTKDLGKLFISKADIKSIIEVEPDMIVSGNVRERGPFTTRYYFTNNALPIKKGEDYAMFHLYGPEAHFAISDNFSLGVMATWIASPIGVAAKYCIPTKNEKVNFSLGTIMLSSGYLFQSQGWGGLHWANMSVGKPGRNVTISGGFTYLDLGFGMRNQYERGLDKFIKAGVISVAGITQVGKRASFFFDSMIFFSEHRNYNEIYPSESDNGPVIIYNSGNKVTAILMPGMRFQKNDRHAFQFALSGFIEWSSIGFSNNNDDGTSSQESAVRSFPAPMASWFLKF